MTSTKTRILLWAGVAATLALSLYSLSYRYRVESRNRAVELVVEMDAVEQLAAAQQLPLASALTKLKSVGVGGVVLAEQSIGELVDDGELQLYSTSTKRSLLQGPDATLDRVRRGLQIRFGDIEAKGLRLGMEGARIDVSELSSAAVRSIEIGINPHWSGTARAAGLRIYARGGNPTGVTASAVRETLKWLHESGAEAFLPQGDQVLGRREGLDAAKESFAQLDLLYASPEFAKLGGDLNMVAAMPERVIRLHSAQAAEIDKMTLGEAIERYVRAGRERNIRALLLRPLTLSAEKPLDAFAEFIGKVGNRLRREGAGVGPAKPFQAPEVPRWVFPLVGLAAALAATAAAFTLFPKGVLPLVLSGMAVAVGAAAWLEPIRPYAALMAALAFPIAAFGWLRDSGKAGIVMPYAAVTGISVVGGLAVAGLLNDLPYFVRAEQFEGVKLAHFFPVFVAGAIFTFHLIPWRDGLQSPITWLQALLALIVLAALGLMFLRTGNDNPAAVSGFELKLRSLLDNFLPVRPRTKEFLFGYPSLFVGLGLLSYIRTAGESAKRLGGWAVLALMVGAIGPTSAVNTLCHLHTPLEVSLLRIAVGFGLGGIIGSVVWQLVRARLPKLGT